MAAIFRFHCRSANLANSVKAARTVPWYLSGKALTHRWPEYSSLITRARVWPASPSSSLKRSMWILQSGRGATRLLDFREICRVALHCLQASQLKERSLTVLPYSYERILLMTSMLAWPYRRCHCIASASRRLTTKAAGGCSSLYSIAYWSYFAKV